MMIGEYEVGLILSEESLRQWPDNVDLLCDNLQFHYGQFWDPELATARMEQLDAMDAARSHWRYWVYGGLYHIRVKHNPEVALEYLDRGLPQREDGQYP